jgi:hypothetical protein
MPPIGTRLTTCDYPIETRIMYAVSTLNGWITRITIVVSRAIIGVTEILAEIHWSE